MFIGVHSRFSLFYFDCSYVFREDLLQLMHLLRQEARRADERAAWVPLYYANDARRCPAPLRLKREGCGLLRRNAHLEVEEVFWVVLPLVRMLPLEGELPDRKGDTSEFEAKLRDDAEIAATPSANCPKQVAVRIAFRVGDFDLLPAGHDHAKAEQTVAGETQRAAVGAPTAALHESSEQLVKVDNLALSYAPLRQCRECLVLT